MKVNRFRARPHGQAMAEFALALILLFIFVIAVTELCHAVWDYVQLVELARRGVRYAVDHPGDNGNTEAIKDVVVYGKTPRGSAPPALPGLTPRNVTVLYRTPGGGIPNPAQSSSEVVVTVTIAGYRFHPWFVPKAPLVGLHFAFSMPNVHARLMMESQGLND